jgi:SAM-dependent methyltransferase
MPKYTVKNTHTHVADIERHWEQYWQTKATASDWDVMSQIVYDVLRRIVPGVRDLRFVELGCGTGRISTRLRKEGADAWGMDISRSAVQLSSAFMKRHADTSSRVVQGSILALPFKNGTFDVAWNAGVIEHFQTHEIRQAIDEMGRITGDTGWIILMSPYKYSLLYRLGKSLAQWLGRWPYGFEDDFRSFDAFAPDGFRIEREWSQGFLVLLPECLHLIGPEDLVFRARQRLLAALVGKRRHFWWALDRLCCRLFGGYLLISVFRKRPQNA